MTLRTQLLMGTAMIAALGASNAAQAACSLEITGQTIAGNLAVTGPQDCVRVTNTNVSGNLTTSGVIGFETTDIVANPPPSQSALTLDALTLAGSWTNSGTIKALAPRADQGIYDWSQRYSAVRILPETNWTGDIVNQSGATIAGADMSFWIGREPIAASDDFPGPPPDNGPPLTQNFTGNFQNNGQLEGMFYARVNQWSGDWTNSGLARSSFLFPSGPATCEAGNLAFCSRGVLRIDANVITGDVVNTGTAEFQIRNVPDAWGGSYVGFYFRETPYGGPEFDIDPINTTIVNGDFRNSGTIAAHIVGSGPQLRNDYDDAGIAYYVDQLNGWIVNEETGVIAAFDENGAIIDDWQWNAIAVDANTINGGLINRGRIHGRIELGNAFGDGGEGHAGVIENFGLIKTVGSVIMVEGSTFKSFLNAEGATIHSTSTADRDGGPAVAFYASALGNDAPEIINNGVIKSDAAETASTSFYNSNVIVDLAANALSTEVNVEFENNGEILGPNRNAIHLSTDSVDFDHCNFGDDCRPLDSFTLKNTGVVSGFVGLHVAPMVGFTQLDTSKNLPIERGI